MSGIGGGRWRGEFRLEIEIVWIWGEKQRRDWLRAGIGMAEKGANPIHGACSNPGSPGRPAHLKYSWPDPVACAAQTTETGGQQIGRRRTSLSHSPTAVFDSLCCRKLVFLPLPFFSRPPAPSASPTPSPSLTHQVLLCFLLWAKPALVS